MKRAPGWIQQHRRESGRWYTRSLYSDRFQNYLSNMGTAYAVMALNSCRTNGPNPFHAGLQWERNESQTAASNRPLLVDGYNFAVGVFVPVLSRASGNWLR